jgi:hypothetical protein
MAINTGKVITGGLLAGLVFNVFDMIWNFTLLASDGMEMVNRLGLDPALLTDFSNAIPWIVIDFVLGFVFVWTYAAMRPRFGPGPKTAILAGMVPYIAVSAVLFGFTSMGVFTMSMFIKSSVLAAISVVAGSLAGAWAYTEP